MYNDFSEQPKSNLFFDIETLPAHESLRDTVIKINLEKYNKRAKKPIKKLNKSQREEFYRMSAISGDFGQIFCIGYAINNQPVEVFTGSETEILKNWWDIASKANCFIGHNIMDFDLRFLFKRSIVHKIKPAVKHLNLSFARYRSFPIFDTMREWEKWNPESFIKLDTLAKVLGLESSKSGGIDGSQVYDFYQKGKYEEIYNYCKKDVELTRQIYNRMIFALE